jgi:hypothetical protein
MSEKERQELLPPPTYLRMTEKERQEGRGATKRRGVKRTSTPDSRLRARDARKARRSDKARVVVAIALALIVVIAPIVVIVTLLGGGTLLVIASYVAGVPGVIVLGLAALAFIASVFSSDDIPATGIGALAVTGIVLVLVAGALNPADWQTHHSDSSNADQTAPPVEPTKASTTFSIGGTDCAMRNDVVGCSDATGTECLGDASAQSGVVCRNSAGEVYQP